MEGIVWRVADQELWAVRFSIGRLHCICAGFKLRWSPARVPWQ